MVLAVTAKDMLDPVLATASILLRDGVFTVAEFRLFDIEVSIAVYSLLLAAKNLLFVHHGAASVDVLLDS